jgi:hypothetical protein
MNNELLTACQQAGIQLDGCVTHEGQPVDGARLLWAIAGNESNWGTLREFVRHEKGYLPGGYYYRNSLQIRQEFRRWGVLAGSSFGSFQIMYESAREVGYQGHPILLQHDGTCAEWAAKIIKHRFIAKQVCRNVADVLHAFFVDAGRSSPTNYIEQGLANYVRGLPDPNWPEWAPSVPVQVSA